MLSYLLKIKITNESVRSKYEAAIAKMETEEYKKNLHKDSGFDLFIPINPDIILNGVGIPTPFQTTKGDGAYKFNNNETQRVGISCTKLIDLGIQCAAYRLEPFDHRHFPQPFYVYPRSSISKTSFRLANNVGIIDSGYRGNLKAALDNIGHTTSHLIPFTRLLQICMPDLSPFKVVIVDSLDDTTRGAGGFGSTGN